MNWINWFRRSSKITSSILYDEHTFYQAFNEDLKRCRKRVIIESPFICSSRMDKLFPVFEKILSRKVEIIIVTRDPIEHNEEFRYHATELILKCSEMGIKVILEKGNHHRKLVIIDEAILWEGSLNILSQHYSKEIMRKIESR